MWVWLSDCYRIAPMFRVGCSVAEGFLPPAWGLSRVQAFPGFPFPQLQPFSLHHSTSPQSLQSAPLHPASPSSPVGSSQHTNAPCSNFWFLAFCSLSRLQRSPATNCSISFPGTLRWWVISWACLFASRVRGRPCRWRPGSRSRMGTGSRSRSRCGSWGSRSCGIGSLVGGFVSEVVGNLLRVIILVFGLYFTMRILLFYYLQTLYIDSMLNKQRN